MPTDNWTAAQRADFGMKMAEEFALRNGRVIPEDDVEFAGMLAIAFGLGQESRDA